MKNRHSERWPILFLFAACSLKTACGIESMVESFDGEGPFTTADGVHEGLDNDDWHITGSGELRNGGYSFSIEPQSDELTQDWLSRNVTQQSFVERMEIRNLDMGYSSDNVEGAAFLRLAHLFDELPGNRFGLALRFISDTTWRFDAGSGANSGEYEVPPGVNVAVEIEFNDDTRNVIFSYDNDIDDAVAPVSFEHVYDGAITSVDQVSFYAAAWRTGFISGSVDSWSIEPHPSIGDFNRDGMLDVSDLNSLSVEARSGRNDVTYDLNNDRSVDEFDRTIWVRDIRRTWFGDSNLDGEFSSDDLIDAFADGKYELNRDSTWNTGDWDGDGVFNSRDLIIAFQDGGYEKGPRANAFASISTGVATVPEPTSTAFALLAMIAVLGFQRRMS